VGITVSVGHTFTQIDSFPVPRKNLSSTSNSPQQVLQHDKASTRRTGHDTGRNLDVPIRLSAYIADVDYVPPPSVNLLSLLILTGYSDATHSPLIRLISPRILFEVFLDLASNIPSQIC
jgi:hypothetical protein